MNRTSHSQMESECASTQKEAGEGTAGPAGLLERYSVLDSPAPGWLQFSSVIPVCGIGATWWTSQGAPYV